MGWLSPWVGEEDKTLQSAKNTEEEHIPAKEDECDAGDLEREPSATEWALDLELSEDTVAEM